MTYCSNRTFLPLPFHELPGGFYHYFVAITFRAGSLIPASTSISTLPPFSWSPPYPQTFLAVGVIEEIASSAVVEGSDRVVAQDATMDASTLYEVLDKKAMVWTTMMVKLISE